MHRTDKYSLLSLANCLSVRLRTKRLWVQISLLSFNFLCKKMTPKSVVLQSRRKLQVVEENLKKKSFQLVRKFFWNKWVSTYLTFGNFTILKNCSSQQNFNKNWTIKNQENFAHRLSESNHVTKIYATSYLARFLQDRVKPSKVRALRVSTDCKFFDKNCVSEVFITCFNLLRNSCQQCFL